MVLAHPHVYAHVCANACRHAYPHVCSCARTPPPSIHMLVHCIRIFMYLSAWLRICKSSCTCVSSLMPFRMPFRVPMSMPMCISVRVGIYRCYAQAHANPCPSTFLNIPACIPYPHVIPYAQGMVQIKHASRKSPPSAGTVNSTSNSGADALLDGPIKCPIEYPGRTPPSAPPRAAWDALLGAPSNNPTWPRSPPSTRRHPR